MKKLFRRKNKEDAMPVEQDVAALVYQMQQQLESLGQKIDTLISQSSEKPFGRFDRPRRFDRGGQRDRFQERSFTKTICAECRQECEVPFKPSGDRPVYCKDCFAKRKESGGGFKTESGHRQDKQGFFRKRDFHKHSDEEGKGMGRKKKSSFRRGKSRD